MDDAARLAPGSEPPIIEPAGPDDGAAWDTYVASRSGATIHHLFGWKAVAKEAYRLEAPYLVARDAPGAAIRGVLPLVYVPRPFTAYLTTGLFGAYGRLLADGERYARELVASAAGRVGAGRAQHLHLKLLGDAPTGVALERHDIWVTARLDLRSDEETIWNGLSRKVRWTIRHARKSGLESARGLHQLDGFYDVLCENMHRKGAPAYGRRFFAAMMRAFAPHIDVLALRHEGRVVSGALVTWFNGTMYAPFASSLPRYFRLGVNHLLYSDLVHRAYELGCHTLDLGSSFVDSTGLDFKLRWRPQLEPISSYVYAAPGARPQLDPRRSAVAGAIVKAWSRLPPGVARTFGPRLCRWIV